MFACFSFVASTPADVDPHVAPRSPTQLLEPFQKCQMARLRAGRVCAYPFQETDEANSLALLRTRGERPCRCAAKQCDEIASPHKPPLQADDRTLPCWRLHCASPQIRAANVRFVPDSEGPRVADCALGEGSISLKLEAMCSLRVSAMGLLTFALNVTLDGCCDHREIGRQRRDALILDARDGRGRSDALRAPDLRADGGRLAPGGARPEGDTVEPGLGEEARSQAQVRGLDDPPRLPVEQHASRRRGPDPGGEGVEEGHAARTAGG